MALAPTAHRVQQIKNLNQFSSAKGDFLLKKTHLKQFPFRFFFRRESPSFEVPLLIFEGEFPIAGHRPF